MEPQAAVCQQAGIIGLTPLPSGICVKTAHEAGVVLCDHLAWNRQRKLNDTSKTISMMWEEFFAIAA